MVGSSRESADLLYAARFKTPDPVVLLVAGRRRWLVVPEMELGRARRECTGCTVLTPQDLGVPAPRRRQLSAWAAALLRREQVRAVRVPATFPLGVARRLERRGFRLRVTSQPLFPERARKTPEEIAKLRYVQQATVNAMAAALRLLREAHVGRGGLLRHEGAVLTAEKLRALINHRLLDAHCAGGEPIVACGAPSADPHAVGSGPLRAGEPIVIDIFPQDLETGYWGDLTRTVVKGRPTPRILAMYRAVRAVQARALRWLRAGVCVGRLHRMVEREFERRGFPHTRINDQPAGFIHGTGHGVGLEIHEPPSLGRNRDRLRPGHVVTIEPGLYHPGEGGVRIEDTVVVTAGGFRYLAPCPKGLCLP